MKEGLSHFQRKLSAFGEELAAGPGRARLQGCTSGEVSVSDAMPSAGLGLGSYYLE